MKTLVAISLFALALTTGFTCSKNTPAEAPAQTAAPAAQEQMAAPAATTETTTPAAGTEAAPAAPATENK